MEYITYILSIIPFMIVVFVNILIPSRNIFQQALLILLLISLVIFVLKQEDPGFINIVAFAMLAVALVFSIYSAINANTQFLGPVKDNWLTYVSMYLSIFTPTIVSFTYLVAYNARFARFIDN